MGISIAMSGRIADRNDPAECKTCLHQSVCQYKAVYISMEEKIQELIASLSDASWCKITAKCAFKDDVPR